MRRDINYTLLASCGLVTYLSESGGNRCLDAKHIASSCTATLSPVAKLVSSELSEKLEQEVILSFQSLYLLPIYKAGQELTVDRLSMLKCHLATLLRL